MTALLGAAGAAAANTAVTYQINVAHTGVQTDAALAPPYVRRWTVTMPGLVSYPLIAQGLVFVTVADGGSPIPTLYALDQASGRTVWSQATPGTYPWANAAYDGGRVFSVTVDGRLTAFDASTGSIAWSTKLPVQYLFSSPPTAANGVVYVGGAGSGGTVYAVNQATGVVLATQVVMNGDHSSPALSDSSVFVSYACNQAYGFAQNTLQLRWHYTTFCEGGGGKTTVYENGRLYTRDFFGHLILSATTGSLLGSWGVPAMSPTIPAPAVRGNTIWLVVGGTLSAQDVGTPASPTTLWTYAGVPIATAPIVLSTPRGSFVIAGSPSGMLHALDASTGAVIWAENVGTAIAPPDEHNLSQPLTGLGAGEGLLVVPAGRTITAYHSTAPPVAVATPVPALDRWPLFLLAALLSAIAFFAFRRRRR